jgi:putative transcriptional regulator
MSFFASIAAFPCSVPEAHWPQAENRGRIEIGMPNRPSRFERYARAVIAAAAVVGMLHAGAPVCRAQVARVEELAEGKLLVAARGSPDAYFAESVILLARYEERSAVGVIINRRIKVSISRALPGMKGANNRTDPVYDGGPVGRAGVLALLRSANPPQEAGRIFADVYLVSSQSLLESTLAAGTEPDRFRVYLGYCGWGAGQLETEVERGLWHILPASAGTIFDNDPNSVWSRLIQQREEKLAWARRPERLRLSEQLLGALHPVAHLHAVGTVD